MNLFSPHCNSFHTKLVYFDEQTLILKFHNLTFSLFRVIDRHNFTEVFIMSHKQIEGEIKYRFASLLLDQMLKNKIIAKDEWVLFKKKLIKKYNPIISVLEEINEKDN